MFDLCYAYYKCGNYLKTAPFVVKADKPEVEDEEDDDEDDDKDEDEAEGRLSVFEILLTLFHCFIYPDSFFLINFCVSFTCICWICTTNTFFMHLLL